MVDRYKSLSMKALEYRRHMVLVTLAVLAAGLLAACGATKAPTSPKPSETPRAIGVRVAPATVGSISVNTSYGAIVEPKDQVDVVPLTIGRLGNVAVDVGAEVHKGQVIAELSRVAIDIQLQQAQAALQNAESNLYSIQASVEPNQVKAQANLATAQAKLDQLLNPSASDLLISESAVVKAQSDLDSGKTRLAQLLNPSPASLQAAQSLVAMGQINLSSAKTRLAKLLKPPASDLQAAESKVANAQSELDNAKTRLEQLLNPTIVQLAVAEEKVIAARSELSRIQRITNGTIEIEGASLIWNVILGLRQALQNHTATFLNPALSSERDPSTAAETMTRLEKLIAELVAQLSFTTRLNLQNQTAIFLDPALNSETHPPTASETKTRLEELIAGLVAQLDTTKPIPALIRIALWSESNAQATLDTALSELEELRSPNQRTIALARNVVAITQAALISAEASLEELQNPNPDDVTLATNVVSANQASLASANATLEQLERPTQDTIDLARDTIDAAQASLDAVIAELNQLTNPRLADIATADNNKIVAEQSLVVSQGPIVQLAIEGAQARVDQAQAAVDQVKNRLGELQVIAPFDGFVAERWLAPGAVTDRSTPIFTITSKEVVVSSRIEAGVGSLQQGQLLEFTSPGFPPKVLELKVDQTAPAGDLKPNTFSAQMSVIGQIPDLDLRPGMSGQVSISTRHENTVLVPKEAAIRQGDRFYLFVVQDGTAHLVQADVGTSDNKNIEILSGVRPGTLVVVHGQDQLNDGTSVTVQQASES